MVDRSTLCIPPLPLRPSRRTSQRPRGSAGEPEDVISNKDRLTSRGTGSSTQKSVPGLAEGDLAQS